MYSSMFAFAVKAGSFSAPLLMALAFSSELYRIRKINKKREKWEGGVERSEREVKEKRERSEREVKDKRENQREKKKQDGRETRGERNERGGHIVQYL
jgi:hypothetical protein